MVLMFFQYGFNIGFHDYIHAKWGSGRDPGIRDSRLRGSGLRDRRFSRTRRHPGPGSTQDSGLPGALV
jgi:hypothetical protein